MEADGKRERMNPFFAYRRSIGPGAACLLAAACADSRDPISQTPVDPEPGLYKVTLGGAGLLQHADLDDPQDYCLREGERADFPHVLARHYYQLHALCRVQRGVREGNAVGGEIICAADPKMAQGSNRFVYNGVVASEHARIEVRMKLDATLKEDAMSEAEAKQLRLGMKLMERFRFTIDAARVGDCA
ncbi:MAG: hypothetical protein ACX939_02670 [Hyphococcus sp.]